MVQTVDVAEPRNLSLEDQQAAVRQRVADRQRQYGFAVTEPAEIYRSPQADRPDEVIQLGDGGVQVLDDQQQADWARNTISRNLGAHQAAAERAAPAVPVAAPAPPLADLRAVLGNAIQAHTAALLVAKDCDQAVEHATRAMNEADAAVGEFHDLDERISVYTIECLRARRSTVLPPDLLTAQRLRAEAIDSSRNLHIAHGTLTAEAQAARVHASQLEVARNKAASAIVATVGDVLADQLADLEVRACLLRQRLRSVDSCWIKLGDGLAHSVGLSSHATAIITKQRTTDEISLDREYASALADWYERLQQDPEAQL